MTIGFEDISQNRVLDELVRDTASCWLALAFFRILSPSLVEEGKGDVAGATTALFET